MIVQLSPLEHARSDDSTPGCLGNGLRYINGEMFRGAVGFGAGNLMHSLSLSLWTLGKARSESSLAFPFSSSPSAFEKKPFKLPSQNSLTQERELERDFDREIMSWAAFTHCVTV